MKRILLFTALATVLVRQGVLLPQARADDAVIAKDIKAVAPAVAENVQVQAGGPVQILGPAKVDPKPAYLGVAFDTGAGADAVEAKDKNDGVGILYVLGETPAAKAGLKEGDRILSFEGKKATDSTQLREMIRASQPDQNVKLAVQRDGKEIEIKIKLIAAPEVGAVPQLPGVPFIQRNIPAAVPGTVNFANTVVDTDGVIRGGRVGGTYTGASGGVKTPARDTDTVTLRDGNVFNGKIRGITAESGLQLQREGLADIELIEGEITSVSFADRKIAGTPDSAKGGTPRPKVLVQMRDGSVLHGDALTMERDILRLTLPAVPGEAAGQRIEIPREHAQCATLSDGAAPSIYEGPSSLAGWSSGRYGSGRWEYQDGFLRGLGNEPIGRDLGRMPDPIDLSFEVTYPAQLQNFRCTLFSSDVDQAGVGALRMNFSPSQINATHYDGQRANQYVSTSSPDGPINGVVNPDAKAETVRYRILVDRTNGRALIFTNGEKRADWKLSKVKPEDLEKCGATFSLTSRAALPGVPFQIGHIRILPWDGKESAQEAGRAEPKGDHILASNGTVAEGTLERITDSEMVFASPGTKIQREKTVFVRFAPPAAPQQFPPAVATLRMRDGSEISVIRMRGSSNTLTLTTRCGPEVTVPLGTMRELNYLPRVGQPEAASKNLDVLTLTDGTQFTGRALLPLAENGVNWKIAASKTPLEIPFAKLAGILFRGAEGPRKSAALKGESGLRLANGDWLQGEVVSLDGQGLVMKTDLTPELHVPFSELRAVYLNPHVVATLSDGASGPEMWHDGWVPSGSGNTTMLTASGGAGSAGKTPPPWLYHDGTYTSPRARSSQPRLAKRWPASEGACAINFNLTSPARSLYFSAQFFNSKEERTITITANGTRLYVYFNFGVPGANGVGARPKQFQIDTRAASSGESIPISLVLDRPAKTFRMFFAGKEVGKIPFQEDEAKEALEACGFSISPSLFSSANGGAQNRVTNLWIAPWSAATEAPSFAAASETVPGADATKDPAPDAETKGAAEFAPTIFLANGDECAGLIEKLTPALVTVNSDAGRLELPGKRITWIRFPGPERPSADHFPRLRFHDRGLLSVNDLQFANDRVRCKTLDGQALDFPIGVVKEVVWRPLDATLPQAAR
ncbi:MAG: PDZ domain-containing protein [Chthoniobacter sp.]|nr:PDZ domain-containing protein [Chthoniobacter sp.]